MLIKPRQEGGSPTLFSTLLMAWVVAAAAMLPVPSEARDLLRDVSTESGLAFEHLNGGVGEYYFAEPLGSGGALFDADNDGDLDVYLVQGGGLAGESKNRPSDRLLRNDLGKDGPRFVDITGAAGLSTATGYGMGVATGDIDNDGDVDLYLTNYGANQLWRNEGSSEGGPRFVDVTQVAGVGDQRFSVSAAFLDYDRDGWLDLYVANYAVAPIENNIRCFNFSGHRDYCGPQVYPSERDRLYRNRGVDAKGNVTFEDVTATALRDYEVLGSGLGVVSADFDGNGWLDLYVANDLTPNNLWLNQGDGTFIDEALLGGCATNADGEAEASMGVVSEDLDGDGDNDLFMAHLDQQTNTFYRNDGKGFFSDDTLRSGLGNPSWNFTGFGTAVLDVDSNGELDVFVANGAVLVKPELLAKKDPHPLHETNQLFLGLGGGRFKEATAQAGPSMKVSKVSRGVAAGDIDNDGDSDLLIVNNGGPARLLLNPSKPTSWMGLRLFTDDGRDAYGARVEVRRKDASSRWRRCGSDGSYASAGDPRLLVGLANSEAAGVTVHWPDGSVESWPASATPAGRYTTLRQGTGTSKRPASGKP